MGVDKAIEILQEYIEVDREIREGDTESDYSKFCENKCEAIESLIKYVYASRSALKMNDIINNVNNNNGNKQLTDEEIKQLIACLDNAIYSEDEFVNAEQRSKLIKYSCELPYKLYELLGIKYCETEHSVDIDTLEIKYDEI